MTLSADALEENLAVVAASTHDRDAVLDLRADAYGHGAHEVERRARRAGFRRFTWSEGGDAAADAAVTAALYGVDGRTRPVMSVETEVVNVKRVEAGGGVSYGYTFRAPRETTLALVGLGFADGIPRVASNRARVSVAGRSCRVVGRIAMDQFMIDAGDADVRTGQRVVLWGDEPRVGEWARVCVLPTLAVTAGLGHRLERTWASA